VKVVVIGYGMAGARLVSDLRGRVDLTVLGAEPHRAYNRILLSNLVAGKVGEAEVRLAEASSRGEVVRLGVAAQSIDRRAHRVITDDGDAIDYDRLVLATGAQASLPPIKGLAGDDGCLPERVAPFRTLDDCRRIIGLTDGAASALVLGGGLLGLEAARGLASRGLAVTVLHAAGHLMERQLDPAASAVLVTTLSRLGIAIELDTTTVAVEAGPHCVDAVLADGRRHCADLIVVACGVRPNTSLAEAAGLRVGRGIVVDDRLRTSDSHIYAIGDCAEHAGQLPGLVAPAWSQSRVVADVLTGERPLARYTPPAPVTRLKAAGIDLAAVGESTVDTDETVVFADPARETYAKLVIRNDRLAGAIMLGDNPTVGTVIQLFDRAAPLPRDRRGLLLGRAIGADAGPAAEASPALMPDAAVICQCNTVSKGALVRAWNAGARDLVAATRAGTGCGSCRGAIDGIAAWLNQEGPS
jgi:assimilatory nitrate reductase electron transfer subunit